MIQILNGVRETVDYDSYRGLKLYHNVETEDYPLHWHTALEIIMPYTNTYTVEIDKTPHVLQEGDIFIGRTAQTDGPAFRRTVNSVI